MNQKQCEFCKNLFDSATRGRPGKYCSDKCKTAAGRKRKKLQAKQAAFSNICDVTKLKTDKGNSFSNTEDVAKFLKIVRLNSSDSVYQFLSEVIVEYGNKRGLSFARYLWRRREFLK